MSRIGGVSQSGPSQVDDSESVGGVSEAGGDAGGALDAAGSPGQSQPATMPQADPSSSLYANQLQQTLGAQGAQQAPGASGPIPPQSSDPKVAVNQNHNVLNPGNVVPSTFDPKRPVPVNTPAQVLDQVNKMADYWSRQPSPQNGLGVFPTAYTEMTKGLQSQAAQYLASGQPEKAQAIYDVMVQFGNRFFDAFNAYQSGDSAKVPEPWKVAFDGALAKPPASVASELMMAMNAHILNDLPQVLRDMSKTGRPGFDLNSPTDKANFREYNSAFSDARLSITGALERNYPGNDVGKVAGLAEDVGIGQFGVGEAVDLMRTKAWDDAANPSVTARDLGHNSAEMSRMGAKLIRAAEHPIDTAKDVAVATGQAIKHGAGVAVDAVEDGASWLGNKIWDAL